MNKNRVYLTQSPKTAYRIIDEEAVIVNLESSMLYSLNSVGTLIWEMSDGRTSIEKIVDNIYEEFEVEKDLAKKDCLEFVQDFADKGLLVIKEKSEST